MKVNVCIVNIYLPSAFIQRRQTAMLEKIKTQEGNEYLVVRVLTHYEAKPMIVKLLGR